MATELVPKIAEILLHFSKGSIDGFSCLDGMSSGGIFTNNSNNYTILVALLKLLGRTNRVFLIRSMAAVEALIGMGLPASILIHRIDEMITSQSKSVRQSAATFALRFLEQGFTLMVFYFR